MGYMLETMVAREATENLSTLCNNPMFIPSCHRRQTHWGLEVRLGWGKCWRPWSLESQRRLARQRLMAVDCAPHENMTRAYMADRVA
jgi:hypothetical protein